MPFFWRLRNTSGSRVSKCSGEVGIVVVLVSVLTFGSATCTPAFGAGRAPQQQDETMPAVRPPSAPKPTRTPPNPVMARNDSVSLSKADQKKGKDAYKRGRKAEDGGDWQAAFDAYSDAVKFDASVVEYGVHQAIAKGHVVQMKIDAAEKAAVAGDLTAALRLLREARELDPSNQILAERLAQMDALRPKG